MSTMDLDVMSEAQIAEFITTVDEGQLKGLLAEITARYVRDHDLPTSFRIFYELIYRDTLPDHAYYEWVVPLYYARGYVGIEEVRRELGNKPEYAGLLEELERWEGEPRKGTVIEAFRGSTKTTTITVAMTAFHLGHHPEHACLFVQVGDDSANKYSSQVADIIEYNPAWKQVFPNVVPDKAKAWGAKGYEVKRDDVEYEEWRAQNAARKDPSLIGLGYKSGEIIGKHPDWLVVDDIHDEANTASERELATVRKILTDTIFPTITPDAWVCFVGTPWVTNDALAYTISTGEFIHLQTPVYRLVEPEEPGAVEKDGEYVRLTWAEKFNLDEIKSRKHLSGTTGFARMYLLDLTAAANQVFKYQLYPASEIRVTWPMAGGLDYASAMTAEQLKTGDRDYFAMAYGAKLPGGGCVITDGVLDKCTQAVAEEYAVRPQAIFLHWLHLTVEGDGKGEEFIQVLFRHPYLRIVPMKTGGKGKEIRLERQLQPWLEAGIVRISDADTPFLVELRRELDMYPYCAHDDALDAVYWLLRGIPDVLQLPTAEEELPLAKHKQRQKNPFAALGSKQ